MAFNEDTNLERDEKKREDECSAFENNDGAVNRTAAKLTGSGVKCCRRNSIPVENPLAA